MKSRSNSSTIFIILSFLLLLLLGLIGCGKSGSVVVETQATAVGGETITMNESSVLQTDTGEVGIESTPTSETITYSNKIYGFEFEYPDTWILTEEADGIVLKKGTDRLMINFNWADERIDIPSGLPAGDLIYADKIHFMGRVIPVELLLFEEKPKIVFYGGTGIIEINDLGFWIVLEDQDPSYENVDLSEEIMAEAKLIVESFTQIGKIALKNSSQRSGELQAYLEVKESHQIGSGEPVILHFTLKNHSPEPLYILEWYTPLEGIAGEIFTVTRDGKILPYMGILAIRDLPSAESYVYLGPGESVSSEVNIASVYDFSQPGNYMIAFRSPRISHIARSEKDMAKTMDELGPVNIPSNKVSVEIVGMN